MSGGPMAATKNMPAGTWFGVNAFGLVVGI
jgi:hypothetical protein